MNRYQKLMQRIENGERILIDGATGTEIDRRGVPKFDHVWNGGGALTHPDIVRQVHEDYLDRGAEIIISCTFGSSRHCCRDAGIEDQFEHLTQRAVKLAVEARHNKNRAEALVAGGITHWSFTDNHPSLEQLYSNTAEQAAIMASAGADLIMLEMVSNIDKMHVMLDAAETSGIPVWLGLSCDINADGTVILYSGGELLIDAIASIQDRKIPLLNIMHTNVEIIDPSLDVIQPNWSGPIGVYAHTGDEENRKWNFDGVISIEDYETAVTGWLDRGVQLIGGCCGIGCDHIAALSKVVGAGKQD